MPRAIRSFALACGVALILAASAAADWGGTDPAHNTPLGPIPSSCKTSPTGATCINAGVYYLDLARKRAGLGPYALPANFVSMTPQQQEFILVNLDRTAYDLPPITGMTSALNRDAFSTGVRVDDDPHPTNASGLNTWWPGWAGAFYNVPMAYEAWVWNDGLGAQNPRCTRTDHSRCWGHRHSVLWKFPAGSVLAMGAAAGKDTHHQRGYAYLFVGGNAGSFAPAYTYTWDQALDAGAGTNAYDPGPSPSQMCRVPVLIGLSLRQAQRAIWHHHCKVGSVITKRSAYVSGLVIQQHPKWQMTLPAGTRVKLTISR